MRVNYLGLPLLEDHQRNDDSYSHAAKLDAENCGFQVNIPTGCTYPVGFANIAFCRTWMTSKNNFT
jgi:hypothetical protein